MKFICLLRKQALHTQPGVLRPGFLFSLLLSALMIGHASAAQSNPTNSVFLIDASRHAKPALVYSMSDATLRKAASLNYLRLSPPLSETFECCVRISGTQLPSRDIRVYTTRQSSKGKYVTARATKRGELSFIGLGIAGKAPLVTRENNNTLLLKWADGKNQSRVYHCVSTETVHMRAVDVATSKEQLRYSLPLGMDVEVDCNEDIMPAVE
jgi:hypothetical protein